MVPLYHDPHFTFRFADDRVIPRFHLEGVGAGRRLLSIRPRISSLIIQAKQGRLRGKGGPAGQTHYELIDTQGVVETTPESENNGL